MRELLVVGAGAIGAGLATMAAAAGRDVACLARGGALASGRVEVDGSVVVAAFGVPEPARLAVVSVKAHQVSGAFEQHRALLSLCHHVVVVRNGLGGAEIDHPSSTRALAWACAELSAGNLRWRTTTHLVAPDDAPGRAFAEALGAVRAVAVEVVGAGRMAALEYEKLMVNASLNPLCAMHRMTPDQLLEDPAVLAWALAVGSEIQELARRRGVAVRRPDSVILDTARAMKDYPPSMLQDVRRGAPTEIDALVLRPLRELRAMGAPSDALAAIADAFARQ